jgi:hypothetical protein
MNNALRKTAISKVTGLQVGFTNEFVVMENGEWRALNAGEITAVEIEYQALVFTETKTIYTKLLDEHLDKKAQERGYNTIHTASLRAALINSPFHAEGVAYGEWMDACNAKGYEILANVQAGEIPLPDEVEFIALLPVLVLP